MKKISITLSLSLLVLFSFGQIRPVEEINDAMSQGTNRGFKVLIPESNEKECIKAWSKLMKEYEVKTEKIKKKEDYISVGASMPSISEQEVTTYANFQETPEGVFMNVFVVVNGVYLNSDVDADKVTAMKNILHTFATKTTKAALKEILKEEEKALDKLEKEQKGLEKDKSGYEKEIKDAEETIKTRENDLQENAKNQQKKQEEIAKQKEAKQKIEEKLNRY